MFVGLTCQTDDGDSHAGVVCSDSVTGSVVCLYTDQTCQDLRVNNCVFFCF